MAQEKQQGQTPGKWEEHVLVILKATGPSFCLYSKGTYRFQEFR